MRALVVSAGFVCACYYIDYATSLSLSRPASPGASPACLQDAVATVPGLRVVRPRSVSDSGMFVALANGAKTAITYVAIVRDTTLGAPSVVSVDHGWFGDIPDLGEQQAAVRASRLILNAIREQCMPQVDTVVSCTLRLGEKARPCPVP